MAGKAVYCEKPIDLSLKCAPARWWSGRSERAGHCRLNRRFDSAPSAAPPPAGARADRPGRAGADGLPVLQHAAVRPSAQLRRPDARDQRSTSISCASPAMKCAPQQRWARQGSAGHCRIWRCRHLHPDDADARRRAGAAGQYPPHRPPGTMNGSPCCAEGALESGSQSPAGPTLWRGNQRIEPGLWPDWFSRVQGSYYQAS